MVISHNLLALNSQRQLNITNVKKNKAMEKLSSGYRINRAADDAAGLAISEKMRKQIRGLTQGVRNAQDGVSMCQVADGALHEVNDMLHRISELAVKAANGTNSKDDREAMQDEIDELLTEIDRVSITTEFNDMPILGRKSLTEHKVFTMEAALRDLTAGVTDSFTEDVKDVNGNVVMTKEAANALVSNMSCYYRIESLYDEYMSGMLQYDGRNGVQTQKTADVMELFTNALEMWATYKNVDVDSIIATKHEDAEKYVTASIPYDAGPTTRPGYNADNACAYATDFFDEGIVHNNNTLLQKIGKASVVDYTRTQDAGFDFMDAFYYAGLIAADSAAYYSDRSAHSYERRREEQEFKDAMGRLVSSMKKLQEEQHSYPNEKVSVLTESLSDKESMAKLYAYLKNLHEEVYDDSPHSFWIQSGAEAGDGVLISFGLIDTRTLGIRDTSVMTVSSAEKTIDRTTEALAILSKTRSQIGAQQNRLEHTILNEENIVENTTAAESAIRDTDMAKEMVKFSTFQILQQAGEAMLSQANQSQNGVLSLLQ